jgi:hypothetical protein
MLEDNIPGLFSALVDDPEDEKWTVFTFPIDYDTSTGSNNRQQVVMRNNDFLSPYRCNSNKFLYRIYRSKSAACPRLKYCNGKLQCGVHV